MSIRLMVEHLLPKEDVPKFAEWAFGKEYQNLYPIDMMHKWNELHSDSLKLERTSKPENDIPKMIQIWLSQNVDT